MAALAPGIHDPNPHLGGAQPLCSPPGASMHPGIGRILQGDARRLHRDDAGERAHILLHFQSHQGDTEVHFRRRRGDLKRVTAHRGCPTHGTHCLAKGSTRFRTGAAKDC